MSDFHDLKYFNLRGQAKTYISKLFKFNETDLEGKRQIRMVFEGNDSLVLGEIDGAIALRMTGQTRKTQVTALVSQDNKQIKRLSLQTFKSKKNGDIQANEKNEFTFRQGEFERLCQFLNNIKFIDLENEENFQIEDISTSKGPKAIIDASDQNIVRLLSEVSNTRRKEILEAMRGTLTGEEVNLILGRKQGLAEFRQQFASCKWSELQWQEFFEKEQWVFGYGLDYRIVRHFDREAVVGGGGVDSKNKPKVDFLSAASKYSVLVEIKKPDTKIFKQRRGRAGTWEFSSEFVGSISQVLEQRAEWQVFSQSGEHYSKDGMKKFTARTRGPKCILVIGSLKEIDEFSSERDRIVMRDTFELFRRESGSIEIVTYDELLERAEFICRNK